ncbi:Chlorohydroquinone/hydroquinone 1 2-dioxygenase [Bienertia sinuspersici]
MADANGKIQFVSGSIQPIDILSNSGVMYFVEFNELHQPIRKGGHILVRFLGSIANIAHYCPIGALTWRDEHFIIPNDEVYDTLTQSRVGKCWRHYKHELKKTFFQLDKKTHEQHYDLVPSGHSRSDWIKLVDHWFSPKVQKLSQIGKEARSLQLQAHIMGSNSYTNLQADYCDAKAKVNSLKLGNSSSSSVDVEDEALHALMNGGDIPEWPQGFEFGVKKSDVYRVRGIIRKEGSRKVKIRDLDVNASVSDTNKTNEVLKKENRELSMEHDENTRTLKTVVTQFSKIFDAVRN